MELRDAGSEPRDTGYEASHCPPALQSCPPFSTRWPQKLEFLFPEAVLDTNKATVPLMLAPPRPLHICVGLCQKGTAHQPCLRVDCKIWTLPGPASDLLGGRGATQSQE